MKPLPSRVEGLIIAAEKERARLERRFEALTARLNMLYRRSRPLDAATVSRLQALLAAEEEREGVILQLRENHSRLKALREALPAEPTRQGIPRRKYGELRRLLLAALRRAGAEGLRVTSFCKQRGLSRNAVHAALSEYRKKGTMPGLERIAPGHYVLTAKGRK